MPALLNRARTAWVNLAGAPVTFPDEGTSIVVSPGSSLCPPGWVGLVVLGASAIATVPAEELVEPVRAAFGAVLDVDRVRALLPVRAVLGPATLAYVDEAGFRPAPHGYPPVVALPPGHPDVVAFSGSVPPEDAGEAGLDGITSPVFVVRSTHAAPGGLPDPDGAPVVAAAGYRLWPGSVAHVSVLTGVEWRGRGLAKAVGAAAAADALAYGLLPQWRARIEPSRRAARALGFHELGTQLSLALDT